MSLSSRTKWLLRFLLLLGIPTLLLGGAELVLRLLHYGYSTDFFSTAKIDNHEFETENEKFTYRFFPPEMARTPDPIRFEKIKPPGVYRIFILGESAAMGDPEPAFGVSRYLQILLEEKFPESKFEIINTGITAINSHVILPIARSCANQNPDLWLIYMGNNEMVGPYGAATVFGSKASSWRMVRLTLALQRTRLGQALLALGKQWRNGSTPAWGGMEMFLSNKLSPDDPRKTTVYQNFERNLTDIVKTGLNSGAAVILNTVAVNLRDCAPFASTANTNLPSADVLHLQSLLAEAQSSISQNNFQSAAQNLQQASLIDAQNAELQFRAAESFLRAQNPFAARPCFERARDLDSLPFRADSRINTTIAQVAQTLANSKLQLLDAAALLATNQPANLPGAETFFEHVHFNFDGNYHLARLWAEAVARSLALPTSGQAHEWPSQAACDRALGLTPWSLSGVLDDVARRLQQPPFSTQAGNQDRLNRLTMQLHDLRSQMTPTNAAAARQVYQTALARRPIDHHLHENFANFLTAIGDQAAATAEWEMVLKLLPNDYLAPERLGESLARQGKPAEAARYLEQAVRARPGFTEAWLALADLHSAQGKFEQAGSEYSRVINLRPQEPRAAFGLGRIALRQQQRPQAIAHFRRAVELWPDYWEAHFELGGQLGLDGQIEEAKREFETVLRLNPNVPMAHLNLGVALMKEGKLQPAAAEFKKTLELAPDNKIAADYLQQLKSSSKAE